MRRAGQLIVDRIEVADVIELCAPAHRRFEDHAELIGSGPQPARDVEAPGAEHVVGAAEWLAVERDRRERVQPVEDELGTLLGENVRVRDELAPILPASLRDPLDAQFLVRHERIRDPAGGHEVQMHSAGDRGFEPIGRAGLAKLPGTVKGSLDHRMPRCSLSTRVGGHASRTAIPC